MATFNDNRTLSLLGRRVVLLDNSGCVPEKVEGLVVTVIASLPDEGCVDAVLIQGEHDYRQMDDCVLLYVQ